MATTYENPTEPSTTSLVTGIIDDVQALLKQQFELARREVKQDVRKAAEGVLFIAMSAGVFFVGGILFCFALVYLLHWATSPAGTDPARVPLWACYGAVGLLLIIAGAALGWLSRATFKSIDPVNNPATEAMKENIDWATKPK